MTEDVLKRANEIAEDLYYINNKLHSIEEHKKGLRVEQFVSVDADSHRGIVEVHDRDFAKAVLLLCEIYLLHEKDLLEKEMEAL